MSPSDLAGRVGYVTKVYPRFSETFVVTEILAHEAAGLDVEIFSLRPPVDPRFHASLSEVRAPVTYLDRAEKPGDVWSALREARPRLPGLAGELDALLAADVRDAVQAVALAQAVRARGIVHLHAHFASSAASVARLAARLAGVPYTFTAHAKDVFHAGVDHDDLRRKLAGAAATVTVSDFNLAHLRATFGRDAARAVRVYNGLDLARFPYADPGARPPTVVSVGRLVEKKGMDVLVDACALLAERGVDLRCVIVGGGELEAGLRAQVAARRLDGRVTLLGPQPQDTVRRVVASAAAFAAPCVVGADGNRDGLPTVLLEAMALGTPCVSTDVTGIPEVLRDGDTGLAVPQRDPAALAAALERLLADAALRVRLARRARALVAAEFDATRQAARLRRHFAAALRPAAREVA
jgi:glycosyltransferase involved in cell wall biosynthesis